MLGKALAFAKSGLPVFPCRPGGKEPLTKNGFKDATTDETQIRKWWERTPDANVAFATGCLMYKDGETVGKVVVIDCDAPKEEGQPHGTDSLRLLVEEHGEPLPPTLTQTTGNGEQLLYLYPPDVTIRNSTSGLAVNVDVRGEGGYALLFGSVHPNGKPYTLKERNPIARAPDWIVKRIAKRPPAPAVLKEPPNIGGGDGTPYGLAALEDACNTIVTAVPGQRDDALNRELYSIGQLIGGGELAEHAARERLTAATEAMLDANPDCDREHAREKLRRSVEQGMRSPRQAPEQGTVVSPSVNGVDSEPFPISVATLDEFISVDEEGAGVLLGDDGEALIPEGSDVMVYGDGGVGKTTLCVDLGFHLASGEVWLGIPVPGPLTVLFIENEGPRPRYRIKLRQKKAGWAGPPIGDRVRIIDAPWAELSFNDPACRDALAAVIRENNINIVICGPLTRLGMDEAGTLQQVRDFSALIGDTRRLSGLPVTFCLVHHENKGGAVSGAWEGAGDTLLHVQGQGHGRTRLFVQKARWASGRHATSMNLIWVDGESFEVDDTPDMDDDAIAESIVTFLSENVGASWRTVLDGTPGPKNRKIVVRDGLFASQRIVNVVREDGRDVVLAECPPGKKSKLYCADDIAIRRLLLEADIMEGADGEHT